MDCYEDSVLLLPPATNLSPEKKDRAMDPGLRGQSAATRAPSGATLFKYLEE